jgi:hypothetical protein
MSHVRWKTEPDEHDYPAAADYLSLVMPAADASALADKLRTAETTTHKSKDLLRAAALPQLDADNVHVAKDLHKIRAGTELSPVLLVRGDARGGRALVVADGYHRICASHVVDEDIEIPCRIIDLD